MQASTVAATLLMLATVAVPAASQPQTTYLSYVELAPCRVINTQYGTGASSFDNPADPRRRARPSEPGRLKATVMMAA